MNIINKIDFLSIIKCKKKSSYLKCFRCEYEVFL